MGADRLVPIVSGHIDGCLYRGDAGVLNCKKLANKSARVAVPATTNIGSLNLQAADQVQLPEAQRGMAYRLMMARRRMGCIPSWTCAPYQRQVLPGPGKQIAWGCRGSRTTQPLVWLPLQGVVVCLSDTLLPVPQWRAVRVHADRRNPQQETSV